MAEPGPDVDIFGPNPGIVNRLVGRVSDLENSTQEFRNNL